MLPGTRCRFGPAVAFQLTTDRTRSPLQAARNYPQRAAMLKAQLDHRAFFPAQVFIVRGHVNTLSPDKSCTSYFRPPLNNHHVPVILNPTPAWALPSELLGRVTYLVRNEGEASLLSGLPFTDLASACRHWGCKSALRKWHMRQSLGGCGSCAGRVRWEWRNFYLLGHSILSKIEQM